MTFEDTTPESLAKQFEVLRRIGPADRAAMTSQREFLERVMRLLDEAGDKVEKTD